MKKRERIVRHGLAAVLLGLCLSACGKEQEIEEEPEVAEAVQEPEDLPEEDLDEEPEEKPYSKRDLLFVSDYQGENERIWFDGRFITEAKFEGASEPGGETHYFVTITMDEKGADLLEFATTELSKDHSILYIVLGDQVLAEPKVEMAITGGQTILRATSYDEAVYLQEILSREDEETEEQ